MEIDHERFATVILSLPLIQERLLSVSSERMCIILVKRRGLSLASKRAIRLPEAKKEDEIGNNNKLNVTYDTTNARAQKNRNRERYVTKCIK